MPNNLTIVNKQTVRAKFRRLVKIGILAGIAYAGFWSGPRIYNHIKLRGYKVEIENILGYDRGMTQTKIEELKKRKFLFPDIAENAMQDSYHKHFEKIKERILEVVEGNCDNALNRFNDLKKEDYAKQSMAELKVVRQKIAQCFLGNKGDVSRDIEQYDYLGALRELERYRKKGFLTPKDLATLEQRIQKIHPDKLVEKAEEESHVDKRLQLYGTADAAYDAMGIAKPAVKHAVVKAFIDLIVSDSYTNAGPHIANLETYLRANPGLDISYTDPAVCDRVFLNAEQYLKATLAAKEKQVSVDVVINALSTVFSVAEQLHMPDVQQRMKPLADAFFTYGQAEIKNSIDYDEKDRELLDAMMKINATYRVGLEHSIIDLYVLAGEKIVNSEQAHTFLASALAYSYLLPTAEQHNIKVRIAERYATLAQKLPATKGILFGDIAKSLYKDAGPGYAQRINALDVMLKARRVEE